MNKKHQFLLEVGGSSHVGNLYEPLKDYLRSQYSGVFPETQLEEFISDYIGTKIAKDLLARVLADGSVGRLLDVGCGYGSFVLAARQEGIEAVGIDPAGWEITFARERLSVIRPHDNPEKVYRLGSGFDLPFAEEFDVLTLWNILEHVPDFESLLKEAVRVLIPGGRIYIICPNYAAFRREAHYQVFWPPLLPRKLSRIYLQWRGKDPFFFETNIFYRTNWGVLHTLRKYNLEVYDIRTKKLFEPSFIKNKRKFNFVRIMRYFHLLWLIRLGLTISFYNPFKHSIDLCAIKRGSF